MIKLIKKIVDGHKEAYRQKQLKKYYEIRHWLIKFFEDLDGTRGGEIIEIPAFIRANHRLAIIKSNRELDKFYNNLVRQGLAARV